MVRCPHIEDCVCISKVDISKLQVVQTEPSHNRKRKTDLVSCNVCSSERHPYLCLVCGLVFCSREESGHGAKHSEKHTSPPHCIFMDFNSFAVYCYMCDAYVTEETEKLYKIMKSVSYFYAHRFAQLRLEFDFCSYSTKTDENSSLETEEECETIRHPREKPVLFDDDSSSVPEDDTPLPPRSKSSKMDGALYGGRCLRPRKRRTAHCPDVLESSGPRGLRNLGNTCFLNSVVQALGVHEVLREYLINLPCLEPDDDVIEPGPMESTEFDFIGSRYNTRRAAAGVFNTDDTSPSSNFLVEELRKILIQLSVGKSSSVSPDTFLHTVWKLQPRFRGFLQHDAHEFLRCTLERLHAELKKCRIPETVDLRLSDKCGICNNGPNTSAVSRIFEGSLQSQVVCLSCNTASNKQESFMDLSLEVSNDCGNLEDLELSDCIRRFFEIEELEQCEQYMCGHCMEKRPSTKQLMLSVLPTVLCFHLKRFRWSDEQRGKVDNMVNFPLVGLEVSPFMAYRTPTNSAKYDLSSVVVHHGSGASSGHYTTYGRKNGAWYHYNDSIVRECSEQIVLQQKAYLLFYTRSSPV